MGRCQAVGLMFKTLDRFKPIRVAIPTMLLVGAGLLCLGVWRPLFGLVAGAILLAVAVLLTQTAQWHVAGDPAAAGVGRAERQAGARLGVWFSGLTGLAVLIFGGLDLRRVPLDWAPIQRAMALAQMPMPSMPPLAPQTDAPMSKGADGKQGQGKSWVFGRHERPAAKSRAGQKARKEQGPANTRRSE